MDYGDLAVHRLLVRDEVRTVAFQRAIAAVVKPGDVVLDLGAGCGILSLFAAQAGAARVYAVERDPQAATIARFLVSQNCLSNVIQVIATDIRAANIPEHVAVIVSEWMGTIGVDENMYGALLWARDNLLRAGGSVIPTSVAAMIAPVATAQRVDAAYFMERPYGLVLEALTEPSVNELLMVRRRIFPGDFAAAAQVLWTTDAASDPPDIVRTPLQTELTFTLDTAAAVTGLAMWFVADLGAGVLLSNSPDGPDTHWGQMLLPLAKRSDLAQGDQLKVRVAAWAVDAGPLMFAWRWQINDGEVLQFDTTGGRHLPTSATENWTDLPPARRSTLSRYLARLAIDPDELSSFLTDPEQAMTRLDPPHAAALRSRDPNRIAMALFE